MADIDDEQRRLAEELGIPLDSLALEPNAADKTLLTPAHKSIRPVTMNLTSSHEVAKGKSKQEVEKDMDTLLLPMSVSHVNRYIENDGLTPRR